MSLIDLERRETQLQLGQSRESAIISVWGPAGAGKTNTAINLAFELASMGNRVCLIDASTKRPAIAAWMGITEPGAGILALLRLARQGRLDIQQFERLSHEVSFGTHTLRLITGISQLNRWPEFDGPAISELLQTIEGFADVLVLDLDSDLEGGLVSLESSVARNEPTCLMLSESSKVLAVCGSDPVSVNSFLMQVRDLDVDYQLVANRVRQSVLGRDPTRQLRDTFYQLLGREVLALLPNDESAVDASVFKAQPLLMCAKGSKLRESIRQLAVELIKPQPTKLNNRE